MNTATARHLEALVEQIESSTSASHQGTCRRLATGWPEVDRSLGGGLVGGGVHEWFAREAGGDDQAEPSRGALRDGPPPFALLMHLARQASGGEEARGWQVWVGRRCWPHPHGLSGEAGLLRRALWVDPADRAGRLWAIDLAARCAGVSVVIADGSGFDMAATRRLQLSAKAGHTLVLLARPASEESSLSAAMTRWRVTPTVSRSDHPRWEVELWRCKGGQRGAGREGPHRWLMEGVRSRGQGFRVIPATPGDRSAPAASPWPPAVRRRA